MATFFVVRYWRGEGPLWKAFWLYGVIPSNIATGLVAWGLASGRIGRGVVAALIVLLMMYTVWVLVSIWRCADNARTEFYGVMARALTAAWALNAVLVSVFLLLDLI